MHSDVKADIEYGESLGYVNYGLTGSGHYSLRHPDGPRVTIAATPSDPRSRENARAEMRRGVGVSKEGPNAAKYKKGLSRVRSTVSRVGAVEVARSSTVNVLVADHRKLCDWLGEAQQASKPSPNARWWVSRLLEVETELKAMGEPVPRRRFREHDE